MGWSDDLNKILQKDKRKARKIIRASVIQAANVAIVKSPVGNPDLWLWKHPDLGYVDYVAWKGYPEGYVGGQFRANWRLNVDSNDYSIKDTTDFSGVMGQIKKEFVGFGIGDTVTFSNPMPYGPRLEYEGWSSQAPDGMVRPAILALKKALNKEASR